MIAPTLGGSQPSQAFQRRRDPKFRAAATLALLGSALLIVGWLSRHDPDDDWQARVVLRVTPGTFPLGFTPDGRTFLTSDARGITRWDVATGTKRTPRAVKSGSFAVSGAFSPDGRTFAAASLLPSPGLAIELIDTATDLSRATIRTRHPALFNLAFAPDGRSLRAFLGDGPDVKEMVIWDASSGRETRRHAITAPTKTSRGQEISPDGRTLAFIPNGSATVQLWDPEADRPLGGLINPALSGTLGMGLGFSADGRALAVGREDGAIDLWDLPTGTLKKTLSGHTGGYASRGLRFAPDGRTLASAGTDIGPRSPLSRLHDDVARRLFGPTTGPDPEMIVVDLATGKRLARAVSSWFPIYSPDGRTVTTLRDDLGIRLRDVPNSPR